MTSPLANLGLGVVVALVIAMRQTTARPLAQTPKLGLVLLIVGALQAYRYQQSATVDAVGWVLVISSTAIGAGLATWRAYTVRLWRQDGVVWSRGSAVTAILWLVGLAQHVLLERAVTAGLASSTLLLYLGVAIFVQRGVALRRARSLLA